MARIGIDIRIFGSNHGGIGRYAAELVPGILEVDKENEYFLFYNKEASGSEEIINLKKFSNAKLVETQIRHYSLGEQVGFLKLLNKYNLDLTHFLNFNVPLLYKRPFVVTIHDMVHHKISGAKKSHYIHFEAYKKIISSAAKRARAIITVSQYSKSDIVKYLNVLPRKVEVIYEGTSLNPEVKDEKIEEVKKKYFLHRPYLLFVGVLERKKNLVSLTRGFDALITQYHPEIDLVIVGKADKHYPEIKHKALDIKNKDRLVFTGYVEDADLAALYAGAYAYTSASLHEGFGLPGVEAMQFGLPLAVSNIEVFNEIYDDAAIYFNPLDFQDIAAKLYLLVKDNQFHAQLQQKSVKRAENFSWKKTVEQTLKVYKEILS